MFIGMECIMAVIIPGFLELGVMFVESSFLVFFRSFTARLLLYIAPEICLHLHFWWGNLKSPLR